MQLARTAWTCTYLVFCKITTCSDQNCVKNNNYDVFTLFYTEFCLQSPLQLTTLSKISLLAHARWTASPLTVKPSSSFVVLIIAPDTFIISFTKRPSVPITRP